MSSLIRGAALTGAPLLLLLSSSLPASAQMNPMAEPPKNLQVLPKDMPRPEVVRIMRGFATSLGVRCDFCHADAPGPHGPGAPPPDFASDDKENKKTARLMMKMVNAINADYLAKLGEGETPPRVACETCHRGTKEPPEPLATKLMATVSGKGVDAAFDQYADLKTRFGDAGLYDFRDQTLLRVARALGEDKKSDESLAVLKRTKALFPQSADVAATLGGALAQAGDIAGAKAELERALSIDPNNMGAKFGLERLNRPVQPQTPAPQQAPPPPR
jgi:photosynthetic reaction center cytochrome c subunit/tetratricopeptide repeat protein